MGVHAPLPPGSPVVVVVACPTPLRRPYPRRPSERQARLSFVPSFAKPNPPGRERKKKKILLLECWSCVARGGVVVVERE